MTKQDLINALEAADAPDDSEVVIVSVETGDCFEIHGDGEYEVSCNELSFTGMPTAGG